MPVLDETSPLLRVENDLIHDEQILNGTCKKDANRNPSRNIVDFDPDGDDENPLDWEPAYKWSMVFLIAFMAFTVTFTCTSLVPVADSIIEELEPSGKPSKSASVLLVTIWELGEAAGPLLIGPLSESIGRYPVMNAANLLFIFATILAASAQSTTVLIGSRALNGVAVASNVLNPSIVGDIFVKEQRGTALTLIMLAPLIGGAIGPAISGIIAQTSGWRTVLWMSAALSALFEVLFLACFRETFKVPILRRKAARLRVETGDPKLRTEFDAAAAGSGQGRFRRLMVNISMPAVVFYESGVLQALSLFGSLTFALFYIMATTLPDMLEGLYGLDPAMTGLSFISFSIGSLTSVVICNRLLDRIYIKLRDANKGIGLPEFRLPILIVGALAMPFVIAAWGWAAQLRLSVSLIIVCIILLGMTLMFSFVPMLNYVVDAFGIHSASAVTAVIVTRCLMGTFLPLAAAPLMELLGYGIGLSILALLILVLVPIPVLVFRYGAKWRQRSKHSRD